MSVSTQAAVKYEVVCKMVSAKKLRVSRSLLFRFLRIELNFQKNMDSIILC